MAILRDESIETSSASKVLSAGTVMVTKEEAIFLHQ